MRKDEIFETIKSSFEKWDKEDIIECISTIISELMFNGVSISACEITPPYIEYADDDGILQREYARRDVLSIREQVILNFTKHDKEVKERILKQNPVLTKEYKEEIQKILDVDTSKIQDDICRFNIELMQKLVRYENQPEPKKKDKEVSAHD